MNLAILDPGMPDHHHVAPICPDIARQNDESISYRMHGMAECLPLSSVDDPVLSEVTICAKSPGLTETCPIRGGYRQVESIGRDSRSLGENLDRGERMK